MNPFKAALAKILSGKYCVWKLTKSLWFVIKYVIMKQTPLILTTIPLECS